MKLHLRVVRFINFMSFGNEWTEIVLDQHPTTLVTGKNGSGKSSAILDSVCFALFNRPFRNINKPQLANSITNKQCIVELEFTANGHSFVVRRGIKPDLLEIYKDDALINETADVRDYQKAFEKYVLKVNHRTFCQIVMLGSAIFTPFMALDAQKRRDVIEDLLDLKIFSRMNTFLKSKVTDIEKSLAEKNREISVLEERIELTEKHIDELKVSNEQLISEKESFIKEAKKKIDESNAIIGRQNAINLRLLKKIENADKLKKKFSDLQKVQHQLQHKIQLLDKDLDFLHDNETCPTCSQKIDLDFKNATVESKGNHKEEVQQALQKLELHFKKVQDELDKIAKVQKEIRENSDKISQIQTAISYHTKTIKELESEIVKLKQKKEEIDTSHLQQWKTELEENKFQLIDKEDDRMVMGYAATMLKDNGIKAQIIKTYIPIINQLISKYLATLDFFVEFQIDENFKERIRSRFRDEFAYESFSEGEKARINLAILFAWRSLAKLRGSIDCNLCVFDEVLDGSLDVEGTDNFSKLIMSLTSQENCVIISHKDGAFDDKFSRTLKFEKVRNFSKLVS